MTNGSSVPQQGETNRITGRVLRGNGSPIKGAALTLIDLGGHQVARAVSDDSGTYGVPVASAGTYVLIASAGTHHPQASTITANGGSIEVNLVLAGRTRLFGTITVIDTGAPVPDATVTLTDERGEVIMAGVTGADGSYSLEGLSGGTFTMVVSAARHRPVATAVTVPQGGEEQFDLQMVGGGRLSGVARSGNGQPVRDALITFVDDSGAVLMTTTTDADGAYTLEDLPSGEYTIIASGYPAVASAVRVEPGAQGQHDVELRYPDA